jgi:hypothetical protein
VRDSVLSHFEVRRVDAETNAHGEQCRTFLGVEVVECANSVFKARQPALVAKILKDFVPDGTRVAFVNTPITKAEIQGFEEDREAGNTYSTWVTAKTYRSFVGSVMYLTAGTRFDLVYVAQLLSRQLDCPSSVELRIADRCIQYLSGTASFGVVFNGRGEPLTLESFSDSDWAGCTQTRRSVSGGLVTLGVGKFRAPIFWRSKQQPRIALSSTEAELVS